MIRRITPEDLDWVFGVARERYQDFDETAARAWAAQSLESPKLCAIRGEHGFALGAVNSPFYAPTRIRAYAVFIASGPRAGFEPCQLLRFLVGWAREQGAESFHLGEGTGQSLAPLAKRIGAMTDSESYVVRL